MGGLKPPFYLALTVNGVIKAANKMIEGLNKLSFDIPSWVPGLGGKKFGLNLKTIGEISIPRIPAYATGQVIPRSMREHLAILGDNNRETEVVSPLSTMQEAFMDSLVAAGLVGSGTGGTREKIEVNVYLDGKDITDHIRTEARQYYKRTGRPIFEM